MGEAQIALGARLVRPQTVRRAPQLRCRPRACRQGPSPRRCLRRPHRCRLWLLLRRGRRRRLRHGAQRMTMVRLVVHCRALAVGRRQERECAGVDTFSAKSALPPLRRAADAAVLHMQSDPARLLGVCLLPTRKRLAKPAMCRGRCAIQAGDMDGGLWQQQHTAQNHISKP